MLAEQIAVVDQGTEKVEITFGELNKSLLIARQFQQVFDPELLSDLELMPKPEPGTLGTLRYATIYSESDIHLRHNEKDVVFSALFPIDINNPSTDYAIALPRNLRIHDIQTEVDNFIQGKWSDLSAAGLAHYFGDKAERTFVHVASFPDEKYRTLSVVHTGRVDEFVKTILNGGDNLGENMQIDTGANNMVNLRLANDVVKISRVHRHGMPTVFIDPERSISFPLNVDGTWYVLQFGFKDMPFDMSSKDYLQALKHLQAFAQKELAQAWATAEELMKDYPELDKAELLISLHDIRSAATNAYGYMGLLVSILKDTPADKKLDREQLMRFALTALSGLKMEQDIIDNTFDPISKPTSLKFLDLLAESQRRIEDMVASAKVVDQLKGKKLVISYDIALPSDQTISIYSKPKMLNRIITAAVGNSIKHATEAEFHVHVAVKLITDDGPPYVEVEVIDDCGGAPDSKTIDMLNDPDMLKVESDTGTLGANLTTIAKDIRSIGKEYGIDQPIKFDNKQLTGKSGFSIVVRLPVV